MRWGSVTDCTQEGFKQTHHHTSSNFGEISEAFSLLVRRWFVRLGCKLEAAVTHLIATKLAEEIEEPLQGQAY